MAKKRKTRRQKMIAVTRRNVLENTIEILPSVSYEQAPQATYTTNLKTYSYVFQDARKTLLTITFIAALNIVLFLMLKARYINFFGLKF